MPDSPETAELEAQIAALISKAGYLLSSCLTGREAINPHAPSLVVGDPSSCDAVQTVTSLVRAAVRRFGDPPCFFCPPHPNSINPMLATDPVA